jgi:hypothetical protein
MTQKVDRRLNKTEIIDKNATKPCHRLGFCPYGSIVEEFPIRDQESDFTCKIFFHDCPIFYCIEYSAEKYNLEDYEREIKELYKIDGLNEIFQNDKIAGYWYEVGSEHSDDDSRIKIDYAIEKILREKPELKETFEKLKEIMQTTTLNELYEWDSKK